MPALMAGQFAARHYEPRTRLSHNQREFQVRVPVVARLGIRTADGPRDVSTNRHQVAEQDVDLPWPGLEDRAPSVFDVNVRAAPSGGGHTRLGDRVEQWTDRVAVQNRRHIDE